MTGPREPADEDGEVHLPHRLLLHVLLVEGVVVEDQPARDGDHGEGVDGGGDAEPQARDHQLAAELAGHLLNAPHLGQDAEEEKDSSDAVINSEGKYHPVSSLAPETSVFVKKKAEEQEKKRQEQLWKIYLKLDQLTLVMSLMLRISWKMKQKLGKK